MMTAALREGLALGKRFEDWMREGLARGPVYHPDMGEDFLEKRLAMRMEPRNEHAFRIADGRWVRVRENRMADGSRVLLITDITEERRRDAELRLLALAVEQAGDPVEITGADHGFTYVNHAFETTTGYSAAEALGREPQDILVERDAAAGVLRRDAPRARGRAALAGDDHQPPPRRPPDRAGDDDRAARATRPGAPRTSWR